MTDTHSNFLGGLALVRAVLNSMENDSPPEDLEKEVFLLGQNDGVIDTEIMVGVLLGLASLSAGLVRAQAYDASVSYSEYLDGLTEDILLGGNKDE